MGCTERSASARKFTGWPVPQAVKGSECSHRPSSFFRADETQKNEAVDEASVVIRNPSSLHRAKVYLNIYS